MSASRRAGRRAASRQKLRVASWFGIAALVVVGALPFVPLAVHTWPALAPLGHVLDAWFTLQCERDAQRTLTCGGVPLAVCARCSGIYFGVGLGGLLRRPALSPQRLRSWVGLAALAMLADVALERAGLHGPWTLLRLSTGLLLGYPLGAGLGARFARAPERA